MSNNEVIDKGKLLSRAICDGLSGRVEFDPQNDESNRKGWVEEFIGKVGFMGDKLNPPESRLEYFLDKNNSFRWVIAANAGSRGKDLGELWSDLRSGKEGHGMLPALHTPAARDKLACFNSGVEAIQEYVNSSRESTEEKLDAIAMAYEALIIWTHIFNDGNGRTSRFIGKLIEDGLGDVDGLVAETISGDNRQTVYSPTVETREGVLEDLNNSELSVPNEDELRAKLDSFPNDIEGMKLNIKAILEDEELRRAYRREQRKRQRMFGFYAVQGANKG
jgi:hypothetical protein